MQEPERGRILEQSVLAYKSKMPVPLKDLRLGLSLYATVIIHSCSTGSSKRSFRPRTTLPSDVFYYAMSHAG